MSQYETCDSDSDSDKATATAPATAPLTATATILLGIMPDYDEPRCDVVKKKKDSFPTPLLLYGVLCRKVARFLITRESSDFILA